MSDAATERQRILNFAQTAYAATSLLPIEQSDIPSIVRLFSLLLVMRINEVSVPDAARLVLRALEDAASATRAEAERIESLSEEDLKMKARQAVKDAYGLSDEEADALGEVRQ